MIHSAHDAFREACERDLAGSGTRFALVYLSGGVIECPAPGFIPVSVRWNTVVIRSLYDLNLAMADSYTDRVLSLLGGGLGGGSS